MSAPVKGKTKHGEMTIDELAGIQPGMARTMDEVARRYTYSYHAAKGGNWKLAAHELNELRAAFKVAKVTRPSFEQDLSNFEKENIHPLVEAIRMQDWKKFEESHHKAMEAVDKYHDKYGFDYVRYVVPPEPPGHMYLGSTENFKRGRKE